MNCLLLENITDGNRENLKLKNGADVNAIDNDGITALMWASARGYTDVVRFLLENGANVNVKANDGLTALIWASDNGCVEVVRLLLENGANVNAKKDDGQTVLMVVCDCLLYTSPSPRDATLSRMPSCA